MDVLLVGGSRFVGRQLAHRLVMRGDRVTLLNRGTLDDGLGELVERRVADRATDAFDAALHGRRFDAVVDFAAYVPAEIERLARVLGGRVGHYVFISTGQVYLVREGVPIPSREEDFDGPVIARPDDPGDRAGWEYGVGKRGCEEAIVRHRAALPHASRIRIPVVHGPGDPERRIESLIVRMLDGGPILVPGGDRAVRHVHGPWLAGFLADRLGDPRLEGALNVAPVETVTVRGIVARVAAAAGARSALVPVEPEVLRGAGLAAREVSPFGGGWMSVLDPGRAVRDHGLAHPPIESWLPALVQGLLAARPAVPPDDLARRAEEIALGESLLASA